MARCLTFLTAIILYLPLSYTTAPNSECVEGLIRWISSNGGSISNAIEIRSSSSSNDAQMRGVYTTSTISLLSNDILASIPVALLFTMLDAKKLLKSILPQNKQDVFSNLGAIDTLSLALAIEYQNADSFWNPYFKCLPSIHELKHEQLMPLWWSADEIRYYFQTSAVSMYMTHRLKSVYDVFNEINSTLYSISYLRDMIEFTLDHWLWSLSIVWSRQFSVYLTEEKAKVKCLVPFGDFFNFNAQLNTFEINPTQWNQTQFARALLKYDVSSAISSDGDYFVFKIAIAKRYVSGVELYAKYAAELSPNFVIFLDYGFCIKNNPMDGMWITVEQILRSLKFKKQFESLKIKQKSQQKMRNIIDVLQLSQIFVVRSVLSEYYMDSALIPLKYQKQFIEPYAYSLFLMSLILNAKNNIALFENELLNFKIAHPKVKSNKDIVAVIIGILRRKLKSKKKTVTLVKNTWNVINKFVKSEMKNFDTSIIQDWMIMEQLELLDTELLDKKMDCALYMRTNEKHILLTVWIQFQRLRELLLDFIKHDLH